MQRTYSNVLSSGARRRLVAVRSARLSPPACVISFFFPRRLRFLKSRQTFRATPPHKQGKTIIIIATFDDDDKDFRLSTRATRGIVAVAATSPCLSLKSHDSSSSLSEANVRACATQHRARASLSVALFPSLPHGGAGVCSWRGSHHVDLRERDTTPRQQPFDVKRKRIGY